MKNDAKNCSTIIAHFHLNLSPLKIKDLTIELISVFVDKVVERILMKKALVMLMRI